MMEIQPKFQILYTEEAIEFLESLEERDCCRCDPRDSEEDSEDPGKGDHQG